MFVADPSKKPTDIYLYTLRAACFERACFPISPC
jgi:hypothetical protein